eukprot:IDg4183t1
METAAMQACAVLISAASPIVSPAQARGMVPGAASRALPERYSAEPLFLKSDFKRFDERNDALFYESPRLVAHIDAACVKALRAFCASHMRPDDRVLDLCAAYISYLPAGVHAVGLGMNDEEMRANNSLQRTIVRDLNRGEVELPFENATFDAVLCALSVDYLTHPISVLREAGRVLHPGGSVLIAFSDRVFAEKAVASWTSGADEDHIYTVASYIHYSGMFGTPSVSDISPRNTRGALLGDPLYVVEAV